MDGFVPANRIRQTALVACLKWLTDERVRYQKGAFDHPSLCVSVGLAESFAPVLAIDPGQLGLMALDKSHLVPGLGKSGQDKPLAAFEELLKTDNPDGGGLRDQ